MKDLLLTQYRIIYTCHPILNRWAVGKILKGVLISPTLIQYEWSPPLSMAGIVYSLDLIRLFITPIYGPLIPYHEIITVGLSLSSLGSILGFFFLAWNWAFNNYKKYNIILFIRYGKWKKKKEKKRERWKWYWESFFYFILIIYFLYFKIICHDFFFTCRYYKLWNIKFIKIKKLILYTSKSIFFF